MNKSDWLRIKNTREYSIESLYEYWRENKNPEYKELTLEEFTPLIQQYINLGGNLSHRKLSEFFDNKFGIIRIFNINGQLIKEI